MLSSTRCALNQAQLGFMSVISVGLAVVSGFGFCIAIGVDFSLVATASIFVMLGLGVDDVSGAAE